MGEAGSSARRPTGPPNTRTALARRVLTGPWAWTLVAGTLVILAGRLGPDWPAQEFRTWLARHAGLQAWNDQWYGGHALPGYSVLFPAISAVLGEGLTGLLAATVSAWLATRLLPGTLTRHRLYEFGAALGLVGSLLIGQVPFLLGLVFGLGALLAVRRGHSPLAGVLAAGCSLSSPLAGLFLLLGGLAWTVEVGWRRGLPLAAAGTGPVVSALVGGGGGRFPYPWTSLVGVLAFTALTLAFAPRELTLLRRFAVLYSAVGLVLFVVPNPVGGNITRIGKLIAVPLACYVLVHHRRRLRLVGLALVPALAWQLAPVTSAIARAATDASRSPDYYSGLLTYLATQDPADGRLEVPFTREHWESALVAPQFPLARGWERQIDLQYNQALYQPLTAASYRSWLDGAAVGLVALPDAPIDYGGQAEAQLLAHPPPYLRPVWHDAHWQVWRVEGAQRLVSGGATLSELDTSSFQLQFPAPGTAVVRIRYSPMWHVENSDGCVDATPDGWLAVHARSAGQVAARASVTFASLAPTARTCSP